MIKKKSQNGKEKVWKTSCWMRMSMVACVYSMLAMYIVYVCDDEDAIRINENVVLL